MARAEIRQTVWKGAEMRPCRMAEYIAAMTFCAAVWRAGATDTPEALQAALREASPGEIVTWNITSLIYSDTLNRSPWQLQNVAGTLIYSDDPETVSGFGILYRDTVPAGAARVYLYHLNGTGQAAKGTVVLRNPGAAAARIAGRRAAISTPSTNYHAVGKEGVQRFYESPVIETDFTLAAGEIALLSPALDVLQVPNNRLLSAYLDFSCDQAVEVTALFLDAASDTLAVFTQQTLLPPDGYGRQGTFPAIGRSNVTHYTYKTSSGIKRFRVAEGSGGTADPPLQGVDAELGGSRALLGNYAVAYRIATQITSDDGRALAVLLNPRGGTYGGYTRVTYPEEGEPFGTLAPTPALTIAPTTQAGVCAILRPSAGPEIMILELIPAGASSLPVEMLLVPFTPPPAPLARCWMFY